jgi:hypothetical protein
MDCTPLNVADSLRQPVSWWVGWPPASIRYGYGAIKLSTAKTPDRERERGHKIKLWVYREVLIAGMCHMELVLLYLSVGNSLSNVRTSVFM